MRLYTVVVTPDHEDGGYTVRVPALPGCNTQGESFEEAMDNAREAIEAYIDALKDLGRPIPEETEAPRTVTIEVAA